MRGENETERASFFHHTAAIVSIGDGKKKKKIALSLFPTLSKASFGILVELFLHARFSQAQFHLYYQKARVIDFHLNYS